jgi:hypothetical protein
MGEDVGAFSRYVESFVLDRGRKEVGFGEK